MLLLTSGNSLVSQHFNIIINMFVVKSSGVLHVVVKYCNILY